MNLKPLSASRLKLLDDCTWKYYCNYELKVPQKSNDGAKRGVICHEIFEFLLDPKNRKIYQKIIAKKEIAKNSIISKMIKSSMDKEKLVNEYDNKGNHNYELICEMILTGLMIDFFCKGAVKVEPEFEFNYIHYENKKPVYNITGIIDKLAIYKNQLKIFDYKTSQNKFTEIELDGNIQAMMYALYCFRIRKKISKVSFIFLRYKKDPIQSLEFKKEALIGFEEYLKFITNYVEEFDINKAQSDMAADKPFPERDEGFKGKLICGYAEYPGQEKKDGSEMWHCPYKFPFDYYVLKNEEGTVIASSLDVIDLKEKENCAVEKRTYSGCPKFNLNFSDF